MSAISDAFKRSGKFHYLLEIDLDGKKHRYSTANVSVPYSSGVDLLFKAKLKKDIQIISSFDFRSFRYSTSSIKINIMNDERLQDLEVKMSMNSATAKIWLWCEGLDWEDIIDYPVFYGSVRKASYDRYWYDINLIDFVSTKYDAITSDTFTGTPTEVIEGILNGYTSLDISQIDYGSIKDLNNTLNLTVLVDQRADTFDIVDRVLGQCRYARTQKNGKVAIVVFDLNASAIHYIKQKDLQAEIGGIEQTPFELICNNLSVSYGPAAGVFSGETTRDRTNNDLCRQSYSLYGPQPQRQLLLADCYEEGDVVFCINRYFDFFAFRHDVITLDLQFYKAWDMVEGDVAEITLEEGPSLDSEGWVDEKFMLIEKSFMPNFIQTKWWRIGT